MSVLRQLFILAVLAALAAGGHYGWQRYAAAGPDPLAAAGKPARKPPTVVTAAAAYRDIETLAEAVGSTRARRAVEITPLASGRITELGFRAGQAVAAGDVLLRLDDDIQRADVIEAQARVTEAFAALARARTLRSTSAVSDESVDRAVAALAVSRANLERSERRLRDRVVTAPFGGVVGFAQVEVGGRVEDGDTVTTLDELAVIEVEFSLPERLFGAVQRGQRVLAEAGAFPGRRFEGQVDTIDSRIDPVGRAFRARAVIANPDRTLPAGMFMHLSVLLEATRALTVPEEAIVAQGDATFAFAVVPRGGDLRVARRAVKLGQRGVGFVQITDGLADGELVVVRGVQRVRDGGPVQLGGAGAGRGRADTTARADAPGGSDRPGQAARRPAADNG